MVVIRESDKGPYFLNNRWRFLLTDGRYLFRVNLNPLSNGDNKPKVFYRLYFKLVFVNT